jgi:hypothetical protein
MGDIAAAVTKRLLRENACSGEETTRKRRVLRGAGMVVMIRKRGT